MQNNIMETFFKGKLPKLRGSCDSFDYKPRKNKVNITKLVTKSSSKQGSKPYQNWILTVLYVCIFSPTGCKGKCSVKH